MLRIRTAIRSGIFPAALPDLALRAGRSTGSEDAVQSA
jgi:hypothetical protein